MGYSNAGFDIVGVDFIPQPNFPFQFILKDVLKLDPSKIRKKFQAVHASPPCKVHTTLKGFSAPHHTNLIPQTRELLEETGLPYVIENVPGAPLILPTVLCGSSFGLYVRRHRLFETNWVLEGPPCLHRWQEMTSPGFRSGRGPRNGDGPRHWISPTISVYGRGARGGGPGEAERQRREMRIDWMTRKELGSAIPPPYTEWIGRQLMEET